ncbi:C39 family peptidase [Apilactobacillus kunkeei]|uniref:GW domain-containing protein n=1 Tax=Apilactobacillus kunkeei TaxID=148814 RepID=A0A0N0CTH2_9LACO|nr:C39 family peptidase [Apilactobacillus kunkeei]KOY78765.1 Uncharacterized protein RZ72_01650 [Apilactobacillus kunkeei]
MKKILSALGVVMFLGVVIVALGVAHSDTSNAESQNYTISSARNYNARIVNKNNVDTYVSPYKEGVKVMKKINLQNQLVQLTQVAKLKKAVYYKISYQGINQGWISSRDLSKTSVYEIPFVYTSQHFPFDAPNGCEGTALKMALSTRSIGLNKGIKYFLDRMPRSTNQNYGFVGNPFAKNNTSQNWTIFPRALAKYGRTYRKTIYNFSGASKNQIINEIKHGNPVIAYTGYRMKKPTGHTLVVVGYKNGFFKMADPSSWRYQFKTGKSNPVFWVSTSQFMSLYNYEGKMAVVVR